ncbi:MAG TPA: NAD(P)/FAD-dependent oxidoreductase [Bacteroidales bacterium]|nr:NAD(P)/FAD-dependent oxidoreductase [Bacteroidales bacterium]
MKKTAIIIGAGPAGLTAALELLRKADIKPVIVEKSNDIGGISKTINYKANRIDIGGHRFFSKSDIVMNYWKELFEISVSPANYPKNKKWDLTTDNVFIERDRLSRIYYLRNFFDYPVSLNGNTIKNLGLFRIIKIGFSYLWIKIFPIKKEKSLEDFFINRFGKVLYQTFFKDYTEKVWGKSCKELSAEWGAQRIKGLSVTKVISNYFKSLFQSNVQDISQKDKETSLIEKFLYPKYGPGQLWEFVAEKVKESGGDILMNHEFVGLMQDSDGRFITTCKTENQQKELIADYVFSTTSVKNLVNAMLDVPQNVKTIANGLLHRNFITVGLLLNKLKIKNHTKIETLNQLIPDNWIYMQESDIKMGRIQIFNNWSPFMVADENNVWIGLEYFCDPGDEMWVMEERAFIEMAVTELEKVGIIDKNDVLDSTIIRMEDTYPVYFGSYNKFDIVREYLDKIENLYLIGRSGMHRYNNSDHSMLTAITAVQNIVDGSKDKSNIWDVNTEQDYHEEKERK